MSAIPCVPHMIVQALRTLLLSSVLLTYTCLAVSQAQVTLDGSLGPRGPLGGPTIASVLSSDSSGGVIFFTALASSTWEQGRARLLPVQVRWLTS